MSNEKLILAKIDECNKDRVKTFAEFIAEVFKDKFIEIYLGDSYESVTTEQISTPYAAVFCGKVVAAYKECLIINSAYVSPVSKKIEIGNIIFISERSIRGLTEIDGGGQMDDVFLRSHDAIYIKKHFIDNNK